MGGSGGNFNPHQLRVELERLERGIDAAEYETTVAGVLNDVLVNANDRDTELIRSRLETIKAAIDDEIDGFVQLLFGGSVAKNTYVDGVSDIDALVVLNKSGLVAMTPLKVRDFLIARLRTAIGDAQILADGFAVSVKYPDGTVVQLVPARRVGASYRLPSEDLQTWSRVRPTAFTEALTAANGRLSGKLVPVIKLAKAALADVPASRKPTGYHLESLALEAFKDYQGPKTPKAMLLHFLDKATTLVLKPIHDRTGQSKFVDQRLGPADSLDRQIVSDGLGRIARRLQNADLARSPDQWRRVLGVE